MHFDRFDICEAYAVYAALWGHDRHTSEIEDRLRRMHFKARPSLSLETLEPNGKEIYGQLVRHYQGTYTAYERYHRRHPDVFPPWPGRDHVGSPYSFVQKRLGLDATCLFVW